MVNRYVYHNTLSNDLIHRSSVPIGNTHHKGGALALQLILSAPCHFARY